MSRFIEQAIARAGLGEVLPARQRRDLARVRAIFAGGGRDVDLLILGALADAIRAAECGDTVFVHDDPSPTIAWIASEGESPSELEVLRAVALARITGEPSARIGVDWGRHGLELAQVALGFGATDLTGPITRKSGALISEHELHKVKGKGMVAASALKRREIAALIHHAGRVCEMVSETAETKERTARADADEAAHA